MTRTALGSTLAATVGLAATLGGCYDILVGPADRCAYEGETYRPGDRFAAADGCNTCFCDEDGQVSCTEIFCGGGYEPCADKACGAPCALCAPDDDACAETHSLKFCSQDGQCVPGDEPACETCEAAGEVYAVGDTFPSEDGCNACTCAEGGRIACTKRGCAPTCSIGDLSLSEGESVVCHSCNTCTCTGGQLAFDPLPCPSLPQIEICEAPDESDPEDVDVLYLDGDALAVTVAYGGGCEEHPLRLCTDGSFLESLPVQLRVWVADDGAPDPCDAWITQQKVFDLSPLRKWYEDGYRTSTGEIILRVGKGSRLYSW